MIKLDIISGFLGAGKTTFCNKILRHYLDCGLRPVFIVNEFGKTSLDAEIIKADGFDALEIEGGCICCTLKDDIAASVKHASHILHIGDNRPLFFGTKAEYIKNKAGRAYAGLEGKTA